MAVNADKLVQIVPRVIDAGTSGLTFNGLFLTQSELPPSGRVLQFTSAESVGSYFGMDSDEYWAAVIYFAGYTNTQYLPNKLFFAPWRSSAASAWLRGGAYEGTLASLRAISDGYLSVNVDGVVRTANALNFSSATSFSQCAELLQTALSTSATVPATAGTLTGGGIANLEQLKGVSTGKLDISVDGEEVNLTDLSFAGDSYTFQLSIKDKAEVWSEPATISCFTTVGGNARISGTVYLSESSGGIATSGDCYRLTFNSQTAESEDQQNIAIEGQCSVRLAVVSTVGDRVNFMGSFTPQVVGEEHALTLDEVADVLNRAFELAGASSEPYLPKATVESTGDGLKITSATTGRTSVVGYASDPEPSGEVEDLAAALALTEATGAISVVGTDSYSPAAPVVTYSSQTGSFQITSGESGAASSVDYATWPGSGTNLADVFNFTEQLGATLSEGMDAQSLPECMTNVLRYARDWVSFSTLWEPTFAEKLLLAQWGASYDTRFVYVLWDTSVAARTQGSTASIGYAIHNTYELDGTCCVYNTVDLAAGIMGAIACLNFEQTNGRTTLAFRQLEGVSITCDDDEEYEALIANGYNVYADFVSASAEFKFVQNGQVSGKFEWLDTYCNAIALKDALQLNILDLLAAVRSLPYNDDGYSQIRTACLDTISRFINFGAIRAGVTLSNTQKIQLQQEIGRDVSNTLESTGWYMLVSDPSTTVRGERGTPNCAFYYMDGGSIQKIVMSSTAIL